MHQIKSDFHCYTCFEVEAKFVVSKKTEILKKKNGFGSDPTTHPPYWDFVPNFSVFLKRLHP